MVETETRRLLLVHAHPDDESIGTGATMARYVADGAHVTLVTCTQGEQGEILVPELAHLAPDQEDRLGEHRVKELAAAMAELGVQDYRFLGGPGRYRDSGMVWGEDGRRAQAPGDVRPDSFWAADLRAAADHLVEVIREVRPQVMVTYDENGGYGHPDHIQAHRVAMYALILAGVESYRRDLGPAWRVAKVYWSAMPRSAVQRGIDLMKDAAEGPFGNVESADELGFVVDDADITAIIDGSSWVERKIAAMRSYPTQIDVEGPFFALSDNIGQAIWGSEHYRLVHGMAGPVDPETGCESDLFAGLGI
ncbi:N-acetyl-1-D-myo-inositol-2-amino-2-deoxy-alpha-D-glucopyranoside deacetylase [Actinobacteria bacterium YIM 96077]|uniref:1D-myo-inositol 2-acetamido-2-deoxy-alpha-D-glucopyranoside deacetylase n=1 Tax=Phytoactinopolyspora halophila TaxID=1981511 RepID=A0A329QU83_9ACTN|nr:N-acetyl-1-D-myo-inositol-2-amino-2-deoxy-alpha-D-glucopyranoside deacetylase [Phytoactinopolyspora halophila]AYY14319.1 N-acetyl-1-D-myo-inositol-2-amino-2-deoxy-alpha-D-glucopyranoside deacetylase [Actinobacteria bacterium YIM 96077]RAW14862.1 N-acetyl-1-D-myo-inositol-2-amino-2-deoxy-alpha-D-glucopyranoside deacetylase [Phytoactinopolyspora halophila]